MIKTDGSSQHPVTWRDWCTSPWPAVWALAETRDAPWIGSRAEIYGTVISTVRQKRRGSGFAEHLAKVVVLWRDPRQIVGLEVGGWRWQWVNLLQAGKFTGRPATHEQHRSPNWCGGEEHVNWSGLVGDGAQPVAIHRYGSRQGLAAQS